MPNVQALQSRFYGMQGLPAFGFSEVAEAIRNIAQQWRASKTVSTLGRLNDGVLQDIGVDRHELFELLRTAPPAAIPSELQVLRTKRSSSLCE